MTVLLILAVFLGAFGVVFNFFLWHILARSERVVRTHRHILRSLLKHAPKEVHDDIKNKGEKT